VCLQPDFYSFSEEYLDSLMKQRLSGGIPNFNVVFARLQGKFLKLSRHSGKTAVNVDSCIFQACLNLNSAHTGGCNVDLPPPIRVWVVPGWIVIPGWIVKGRSPNRGVDAVRPDHHNPLSRGGLGDVQHCHY